MIGLNLFFIPFKANKCNYLYTFPEAHGVPSEPPSPYANWQNEFGFVRHEMAVQTFTIESE
jgi:hypothetical protein